MRLFMRVMVVMMGAITLMIGAGMVAARARTDTPPSGWVAFRGLTLPSSSGRQTFEAGIYVVRADGHLLRQIVEIRATGDDWTGDLLWSPDGEWLVFTDKPNSVSSIYRVSVDGRRFQDLISSFIHNFAADPALSPDGEWIAFISDCEGDFGLYLMRPDGSGRQCLVTLPVPIRIPAWSPDSEWIAFVEIAGGSQDIYRVRADGTDLQRLTDNSQWRMEPLAWSPDGAWLIFQAQHADGDRAVFRTHIETGDIQALTAWQTDEYMQSLSPDGQWIITAKNTKSGRELFRMRSDGSGGSQLLNPADVARLINQWGGMWSADGRWIAYMNMGSDSSVLYRLSSAGGPAQQLTDPKLIVSSPVWSPPVDAAFRWWIVIGVGAALVAAGIVPRSRR